MSQPRGFRQAEPRGRRQDPPFGARQVDPVADRDVQGLDARARPEDRADTSAAGAGVASPAQRGQGAIATASAASVS